jgi:hypothetical protein
MEGDLDTLIANDAVRKKEILAAGQFRLMAPHFDIDREIVWGATAMILGEFRAIVQELHVEN